MQQLTQCSDSIRQLIMEWDKLFLNFQYVYDSTDPTVQLKERENFNKIPHPVRPSGFSSRKEMLLFYKQQARSQSCPERPKGWVIEIAEQIAIPDHLGNQAERGRVRKDLYKLCNEVDQLLFMQIELFPTEGSHRFHVMRVVGYEVDHTTKKVSGFRWRKNGLT